MFIILHKTSWILSSIKSYVSKAFIIFLESIVLHLSKLISKAFTDIFVVDFSHILLLNMVFLFVLCKLYGEMN